MSSYYEHDCPDGRHIHFDSVASMMSLEVTPVNRRVDRMNDYGDKPDRYWWGIDGTREDVKRVVRDGWPEGERKMREDLGDLNSLIPRVRTKKRRKVRRDQGNELDIHRVLAGDLPRAWNTTQKVEVFPGKKRGKHVTIAIQLFAACVYSGEQLFWKGATALMLAEQLTRAGYVVEILGAFCCTELTADTSKLHIVSVTLKSFDQRLNPASVIVTTALSGFVRGPLWTALCGLPYQIHPRMGLLARNALRRWIPPRIQKNADHIVYVDEVYSRDAAKQFIENRAADLLKKETTHERKRRSA